MMNSSKSPFSEECMQYIMHSNHSGSNVSRMQNSTLAHDHLLFIGAKYQEPNHVSIPVTVFYGLLFVFGVLANSLTMLTLITNLRMKISAIRFYLLSLALADFLLLLTIPVTLYRSYWHYYPWLLTDPVCRLYFMIRQIYCATTSWTIIAFTAERYIAICHPMWSITGLRQSRMTYLLAIIWLLAFATSVPFAVVYGQSLACVLDYTSTTKDQAVFHSTVCEMVEKEPFPIYISVIKMRSILCFLVPLISIVIFHVLIFRHLTASRRQREEMGLTGTWNSHFSTQGPTTGNLPMSEKKARQLMGAVIVAFFLCNFPDTASSLMHIYISKWTAMMHTVYAWLKFYLSLPLWYVNSALDPLLFCISSASFRRACRESLVPLIPWIGKSLNGVGKKLQVSWAGQSSTVFIPTPRVQRSSWTLNSTEGDHNECYGLELRTSDPRLLSLRQLSVLETTEHMSDT
ncbi:neurotensin receptor type 1-like [Protopterus annectens]|uniref:neurotensin receptor type 1-like n=1 Tax=Protopterus annectens TaxID=7888 RepID=UPI001CFBCF21|nr:neurotensin receptor type 1-like [Protopterus annectens]